MLESSAFGYNSVPPIHREVRQMMKNRDRRDKARIEGVAPLSTNPLEPTIQSAGFCPSEERFKSNAGIKLAAAKQQERERKAQLIESRKKREATREEHLWEDREREERKTAVDSRNLAGTSLRGKGSVGYNLINGSWGSSDDAAKAKYHDDLVEYTAKLRSKNLDLRANSGMFSIITGEQRLGVIVPPTPAFHPLEK